MIHAVLLGRSEAMGRKGKTDSVDMYFDKLSTTSGVKPVSVFKCKCCSAEPFSSSSRTRLVAHLVGIAGQGVTRCDQRLIQISPSELRAIAAASVLGKRHLETHEKDDPNLTPTTRDRQGGKVADDQGGCEWLLNDLAFRWCG